MTSQLGILVRLYNCALVQSLYLNCCLHVVQCTCVYRCLLQHEHGDDCHGDGLLVGDGQHIATSRSLPACPRSSHARKSQTVTTKETAVKTRDILFHNVHVMTAILYNSWVT